MEIKLYRNFNKRINSTKRPSSTPVTKDVRLKENTSILSPSFLLSGDDVNFNYLYVKHILRKMSYPQQMI